MYFPFLCNPRPSSSVVYGCSSFCLNVSRPTPAIGTWNVYGQNYQTRRDHWREETIIYYSFFKQCCLINVMNWSRKKVLCLFFTKVLDIDLNLHLIIDIVVSSFWHIRSWESIIVIGFVKITEQVLGWRFVRKKERRFTE